MNFKESLQKLGIEKYADRIYNSNSRGELFHLQDYFILADTLKDEDKTWFSEWFEAVVKKAEEKWKRPESIFQHIYTILTEQLEEKNHETN